MDGVTNRCPSGGLFDQWSFSAIVMPAPTPNRFTPQLGAPTGSTLLGYQQYQLMLSQRGSGHYLWRMTFPQIQVTPSDGLNGIDARYQVDFYAVSYRTYDVRTGEWSQWSTKGSFGNEVHFAQFAVERQNGRWVPRGTIYMQPMGAELHPVQCANLPSY
jgi:hypothetical protein